ncbi:VOC family protein [Chryseobacterium sp. MYb264]|uniref:VOC family protein n=1 Tax=Chryseobacterium sp. MYb264 TaxID=2745153 RepID=UPI002E0F6851|nr:VOC family protein [Chryseobacterium sp. MYb264]
MNIKIEHIAIWCKDLEVMKAFYMKYFRMTSNEKYINPVRNFESYFLSFNENESTKLELMKRPDIIENLSVRGHLMGFCHLAISVGNRNSVDILTDTLRSDGYTIMGEPRVTGDGFYESIVEDPEGNWVEITE